MRRYTFVEKDGYLAVKPKGTKLTYAEVAKINANVEAQDCLIGGGGNPITNPITNNITSLRKIDIKVK